MVMSNSLFSNTVLDPSIASLVPANHVLRPLEATDFRKGFIDCLSNLTITGQVSEQMFVESFEEMQRAGGYFVIVVEDLQTEAIVASGTLVVEQKFLRACGRVGHVEDIVVAKGQQGKRFGVTIVKQLVQIANVMGCYKTILDCDAENVAFYEKCGMQKKAVQMALYAPEAAHK